MSSAPLRTSSATVRYLHIVPQLVRLAGPVHREEDRIPSGVTFSRSWRGRQKRRRRPGSGRIQEALRFRRPSANESWQLWRDDGGTPHLRGRYEHWRPQGAWAD